MITKSFSVNREYEIKCKAFLPDNEEIDTVVIGVHGFAGDKDSSMLKKLGIALTGRSSALICFDFPCHGESPAGEETLTVENCKSDLFAVIKYVKEKYPSAKKSIFATSFGGYIALLCAPDLSGIPLVLRAPAVTMLKILLDTVLKISAENFRKAGTVRCGFERLLDLPYSFSENLNAQESVYGIKLNLPTLIIHGDLDNIVPPGDVFDFAKTQDNVNLEIINGADHRFKNRGEIEKVIDLTMDFLNI